MNSMKELLELLEAGQKLPESSKPVKTEPQCKGNCMECPISTCIDNPRHETEEVDYGWITCQYCGRRIMKHKPNQKYCTHEENPECFNMREDENLTPLQWIHARGMSKDEFIQMYGEETFAQL